VNTGTILSFDIAQGYGFIDPDEGGEDVFLHIRTIGEQFKDVIRPGLRVAYTPVLGDRGAKASEAYFIDDADPEGESPQAGGGRSTSSAPSGGTRRSAVTESQFSQLVIEALLEQCPSLTGSELLSIRSAFRDLAKTRGWIDD
jgi:cold shock CspA family protein